MKEMHTIVASLFIDSSRNEGKNRYSTEKLLLNERVPDSN
jgi:hypothetical protein